MTIDAEDLWTDYRTGLGFVGRGDREIFLAGVEAGRRTAIALALLADIRIVAARLATQDNRGTDAPIFIVEEKRRVYGFDPAYSYDVAWIDSEGDVAEPHEHARLESYYNLHGATEPPRWTRTAYKDEWRFVTACFTEAGCAEYIRINKHNHRGELRIYASSSHRNEEWKTVRLLLLAFAED